MQTEHKKDVDIIHFSQYKMMSPDGHVEPLLSSTDASNLRNSAHNARSGVYNRSSNLITPHGLAPSQQTSFEHGHDNGVPQSNLPYEFLITTKGKPKPDHRRQMGIHSKRTLRRKMKLKQPTKISPMREIKDSKTEESEIKPKEAIEENLGMDSKRNVLISDPSVQKQFQEVNLKTGETTLTKNRLSQRVKTNQILKTPQTLNEQKSSITSQEMLPSIERFDPTRQPHMWSENLLSARSNEAEYMQRLERINNLGKSFEPVRGRDHHRSDKASLISSGNVNNLVVFKQHKKMNQQNRNASVRQIELLNMHDQQSQLQKKKTDEKKQIVRKYNRNLILEARDEAIELQKLEILSPIIRRNNNPFGSKDPFTSMDKIHSVKNQQGINIILPDDGTGKKSQSKVNLSKNRKKKTSDRSNSRKSDMSKNNGDGMRAGSSQASPKLQSQSVILPNKINDKHPGGQLELPSPFNPAVQSAANSPRNSSSEKQQAFMNKLNDVIQNKMNGQINLKNYQFAQQHLVQSNKNAKFKTKIKKSGLRSPKVESEMYQKNKLFFSQQHLERMLSAEKDDPFSNRNHYQSVSFLPHHPSISSHFSDNQNYKYGSLPKIETSNLNFMATSPRNYGQNMDNFAQNAPPLDDSILSYQDQQQPLIQISNLNKVDKNIQESGQFKPRAPEKQRGLLGKSVNFQNIGKMNTTKSTATNFQPTQDVSISKTSSVSAVNNAVQPPGYQSNQNSRQIQQKFTMKPFQAGTTSIQILSGSINSQKFEETQNENTSIDRINTADDERQNNIEKTFELVRDLDFEMNRDVIQLNQQSKQGNIGFDYATRQLSRISDVQRQHSPIPPPNLSSILSKEILRESQASPTNNIGHMQSFSQMTQIENQFLELTQEILHKGQSKLEQNKGTSNLTKSNGIEMMLIQDQNRDVVREMFSQADYEIKKSYQELKNLLQNDKSVYENINVPEVAIPSLEVKTDRDLILKANTKISMLKDLQYFYKVECPLEKDPETQKLRLCCPTIHIYGPIDKCNLEVYGSFSHKLPGPKETMVVAEPNKPRRSKKVIMEKEQNYQQFLKSPTKFTIPADYAQIAINNWNENQRKEESGGDGQEKARRHLTIYDKIPYYICMICDEEAGLNLNLKTTIRLHSSTVAHLRQKMKKQEFLQRSSLASNTSDTHLMHSRSQQKSLALTEKFRQDVHSGIHNKEHSRELIAKMKEMMKRKRIADFLRNQFGTSNKYLQDISQQEIQNGQVQTVNLSFRDLNQKVLENIQMQGLRPNELSQYFPGKVWASKMNRVVSKKNQIEEEKRLRVIQDQGRWDNFRARRDQAIQKFVDIRKQQVVLTRFLKTLYFFKYVKQINTTIFQRIKQIKTQRRIIFFLKISIGSYKKRMQRQGKTYQIRATNLMKFNFSVAATLSNEIACKQTIKKHLMPFMLEYQYRDAVKEKFRHTVHRVLFIQHRFRQNQAANEAKLRALSNAWDKELQDMQKRFMQNHRQTALKKLIEQVEKVPIDVKEACLRRYLAACKYIHALAFFQWRKQQSEQKSTLLASIIEQRLKLLHMKSLLREQLFNEAQSDKKDAARDRTTPSSFGQSQLSLSQAHRSGMKWRSSGISHQDIQEDMTNHNLIKIKKLQTKMVYLKDEKYLTENAYDDEVEPTYLIKSFEEINLADPFPNPKNNKKGKNAIKGSVGKRASNIGVISGADNSDSIETLVYGAQNFEADEPPTLVFIPTKIVLKKMMRLCTQVNDYNEIFYYF